MIKGPQASLCIFLIFATCNTVNASNPPQEQQQLKPVSSTQEVPGSTAGASTDVTKAWWLQYAAQSLRPNANSLPITLESAIVGALHNSSQVKIFSELPLIRRTAIQEADAAFDWTAFLDSTWDDINEPVGSTLTVGGNATRFSDHNINLRGGIRRRTYTGGQLEITQQLGHQNTNSTFFIPNPQGTSRLTLGFTQPLLQGRGKTYNQSLIVLAQIDKAVAETEFHRQLQSHLIEVSRAYWGLYLERGLYVQKFQSFERAKQIFDHLEARQNVDVSQSQLISARASMTERRADLYRSSMAIKNAEARLRTLINDPSLGLDESMELIPQDIPRTSGYNVSLPIAMADATQYRPEVAGAIKRVKAAGIRVGMTKHELMPILNLVTETYVSGLVSNDPGNAFSQSFREGAPSYSIGLNFEIPLGGRAAKARHERQRLEHRQIQQQYKTTLSTIRLEVEVAVRELSTSLQEMSAKGEAVHAREAQLSSLQRRWKALPGEDVATSLALENLLVAQERLQEAEHEYLRSIMTHNLATITLKQARGTLLQEENISVSEYCQSCLPTRSASKVSTLPLGTHN